MAAEEGRRSFLQRCGQSLLYGPMLMCVGAAHSVGRGGVEVGRKKERKRRGGEKKT